MRLFKAFLALLALLQLSPAIAQDTVARGLASQALSTSSKLTRLYGDAVPAPSSNLSYAAGGAGALTGIYTYNVTYVTALGETAPWSGTPAQLTLSSQQASLTNIPIGPTGVLKRRIYRSKANPGEVKNTYFLTEIADNTTTTFSDNTADASLGSPASWVAGNYGQLATNDGYPCISATAAWWLRGRSPRPGMRASPLVVRLAARTSTASATSPSVPSRAATIRAAMRMSK